MCGGVAGRDSERLEGTILLTYLFQAFLIIGLGFAVGYLIYTRERNK